MDAIAFCKQLASRITADEWRLLEHAGEGLHINEHNCTALLEMRAVANAQPGACDADGDALPRANNTETNEQPEACGAGANEQPGTCDAGANEQPRACDADENALPEASNTSADALSEACDRDIDELASVDIDADAAETLEAELQAYLDTYMAEAPEGHKWIILASQYLTFVARRPMHPIERAGVIVKTEGERTVYLCPSKTPGDNPICDSCVCEPANTRTVAGKS